MALIRLRLSAASVFALLLCSVFGLSNAHAATFVVTTNSDAPTNGVCEAAGSGDGCTLREAITAANSSPGSDAIVFKIGASGSPSSITIKSALPEITVQGGPVFMDGFSQGGASYSGQPLIEINGNNVSADGLVISAGGSTVRGLTINRFAGSAIRLTTGGGNAVQGCYLGTNRGGSAPANNQIGVYCQNSANNTIGGSSTARNLISGNGVGVFIEGNAAQGNRVQGNYIGTNKNTTADIRNLSAGVRIADAPQNLIGGTSAEARNIISGNFNNNVHIVGTGARGNIIQGNYIGTDKTGTKALLNFAEGIRILEAPATIIGGASPGARNVIAGNLRNGIKINVSPDTTIAGNYIGTDKSGTVAVGNNIGINLTATTNTLVGGLNDGARNLISGNTTEGITVLAGEGPNAIQGNYVGTDATGTKALPNMGVGIGLRSSQGTTVGGTVRGARNIIAGNSGDGIVMDGFADKNTVQGNYIGTDKNGANALPNRIGMMITGSANNLIGGTASGAGNVISGNDGIGIYINGSTLFNLFRGENTIQGNYIGLDATGTSAIPNTLDGIGVLYSPSNQIGGTARGARNIISGNYRAIIISGKEATDNKIEGNYIGTDVTGTQAIGNGVGVELLVTTANSVGGTAAGAGNLISLSGKGVFIAFSNDCRVQGNYIGTDVTGKQAFGNEFGITIETSRDLLIGGSEPGARNVISGNAKDGINIFSNNDENNPVVRNTIRGNYIGTDSSGRQALANGLSGITIEDAAETTIGGPEVGDGNVISANGAEGIVIKGGRAIKQTIQGNYIGVDASGAKALGNGREGIKLEFSSSNTIGGTTPGARNIISANGNQNFGSGLLIGGNIQFGGDNIVQGNYIGTDVSGKIAFGNANAGIFVDNSNNNTIGGAADGAGNIIAFNKSNGVNVENNCTGNKISQNSVFDNRALGINLHGPNEGLASSTPNDANDADTGANNLQNYPVLSPVINGVTTATLNSTPNTAFRLEFFANTQESSSAFDAGRTFLSAQNVTTNSSGLATFDFTVPAGQRIITATATNISTNDTSEFSPAAPDQNLVLDLDADNSSGATGNDYVSSYQENGAAVRAVDSDLTISAPGDTLLQRALAVLGGAFDSGAEALSVDTTGTNITATYDAQAGVLTLNGSDTVANYERVLRSLTYSNTRQNPTTRIVSLRVETASGAVSNGAQTTLRAIQDNLRGFIVNSNADPGDGVCTADDCTLREAISAVNLDGADNKALTFTINFDTKVFPPNASTTIALVRDQLPPIRANAIINGPGANALLLDGDNSSGIVEIRSGSKVHIKGVTMANVTLTVGSGGAILNVGELTLTGCVVRNNEVAANAAVGGGIANAERAILTLNDCTFSGNKADAGGGVVNDGTIFVNGCTFLNNDANGIGFGNGAGGGIFSRGAIVVKNSVFRGNTAVGSLGSAGGAIAANFLNARIENSTFSNNQAASGGAIDSKFGVLVDKCTFNGNGALSGGAIEMFLVGNNVIRNSTFSGNTAVGEEENNGGGAISVPALENSPDTALIESCTITGNAAPKVDNGQRGGVYSNNAKLNIRNSIIVGNSGDLKFTGNSAKITNGGYNIIGNNTGVEAAFPAGLPSDANKNSFVGTSAKPFDPLLAPLADNGGPTPTHALLAGSPAVDKGKSFSLTTDQRGYVRPFDRPDITNAVGGDGSDIGAFELQTKELPAISINDVTVKEGNSGTTNAVFTVTLSAARAQDTTINYAVANGEAVDGKDFDATSVYDSDGAVPGILIIPAGRISGTITVPVLGDVIQENNEHFYVLLSLPDGVNGISMRKGRGVGTIEDNDALPKISVSDISTTEGDAGTRAAVFTLKLSNPSEKGVSVNVATQDGTAKAGEDYVALPPTLVKFNAGSTEAFVRVEISGDELPEGDENFSLLLSDAVNATISRTRAIGIIADDDESG